MSKGSPSFLGSFGPYARIGGDTSIVHYCGQTAEGAYSQGACFLPSGWLRDIPTEKDDAPTAGLRKRFTCRICQIDNDCFPASCHEVLGYRGSEACSSA